MSEYIIDEDTYNLITKFGSVMTTGDVVRCRDYANFKIDHSDHEYREPYRCHRFCSDFVNPNGFCAWAERRAQ